MSSIRLKIEDSCQARGNLFICVVARPWKIVLIQPAAKQAAGFSINYAACNMNDKLANIRCCMFFAVFVVLEFCEAKVVQC